MANSDEFKFVYNNNEQRSKQSATKVLIISSVNDDNEEKILSYLTPTNGGTTIVNLNSEDIFDRSSIDNNKRHLLQLRNEAWNDFSTTQNIKRRKADLTCVVCAGHAYGYNFGQIICESCKAFFRRNALHRIEETKCLQLNKGLPCNIRYDIKHKCQRCRLLKCLESGMRKDLILTPEERLSKQQRLEENRRMRSAQTNININDIKIESIEEFPSVSVNYAPIITMPSYHLTETDWSYLYFIQNAYARASQSTPSASSLISVELASDKMSTYMNTLDIQNFSAVRLINFLKQIPDFEQLDENDRLILVKYNMSLLGIMRCALTFDTTREMCYDDTTNSSNSLVDEEAFAERCKSMFILCYGYEFNRSFWTVLHTISNLVDKDPIIVQLLILIMILLKGLSADDDQEPMLNDSQRVFLAQSKFTDLLFRYLIERSSFNAAVIKMMRIVEVLIKIQRLIQNFHQDMRSKIDINYVNPLMKSLINFT